MSRNKENIPYQPARKAPQPSYNLGRTPPGEDFFTDSLLDNSKIPTPSPTRPALGVKAASRPRRAIGNTKTLKAAWESNSRSHHRSSSDTDAAGPASTHLKPAPLQTSPKKRSPAPSHIRTSTPSPPRRAGPELTSPNSESSPPKGLDDVYRRIADEEDLAAQEGQLDEEDYTEDSMAGGGVDITSDRELLERLKRSTDPRFLPRSRKGTPDARSEVRNKENTRAIEESPSEASGISFLQGLTNQDLAAKLVPHTVDRAKDRERLEMALMRKGPIAFNRAHTRPKPSPGSDSGRGNMVTFSKAHSRSQASQSPKVVRDEATNGDNGRDDTTSSSGSGLTERSEPPPNVPRTWGSKGRIGKEWLQRSSRNSSPVTNDVPNRIVDSLVPESSQLDWAAAAAVPLPSVEDSLTPRKVSPEATASAKLHKQSSLDQIKDWTLNDFTGQSFQVSNTPPVKVRTNLLDRFRHREIETLEKQAVTTNRLSEISRKNSQELLRKMSRSPSIPKPRQEEAEAEEHEEAGTAPVDIQGQGEPIPNTPIVVYKSSNTVSSSESDTKTGTQRPSTDGNDSRNLLQRLGRAMSDSPRTSQSPEDWSLIGKNGDSIVNSMPNGEAAPNLNLDLSRKSSKQVVDVEDGPQEVKTEDDAKTPRVTGAWTDTILPDTGMTTRRLDQSLRFAKTPHVRAGGWMDTPMPDGKRQSSAMAPMTIEEIPEGLTDDIDAAEAIVANAVKKEKTSKQDVLPKSALAGLLEKARRKLSTQGQTASGDTNDTLNLGDGTIESLEDLLTLDAADMTTLIRMGAESEARDQIAAGEDDAVMLERLGSKLDRLRTNIHDARKGISKLEHQVADGHGMDSSNSQWTPTNGPYKVYITIPVPRFFHDWRKGQLLPRPTLLGWIWLISWAWYLSESVMCYNYCHPAYAEFYDWPSEPEPVFPFALPTMLWRWSGLAYALPLLLGPVWTLLVALTRLLGQVLGLSDGFVDAVPRKAASRIAKATQSPAQGLGLELSMTNDEYV